MKEYRKFHASVADLCLRTLRGPLFFLGLMLFFVAIFKVFLLMYLVPSPAFAVEMIPDVLEIETDPFSADLNTEHLNIGELDRAHLHGAHLHGALLDNAHLGGTPAGRMTDSVHVSLYHAKPPGSLKIVNPDSPVLLSLDGQRIQLPPNQVIEVTASDRSILVHMPEAGKSNNWSDGGTEAEQTIQTGFTTRSGSTTQASSAIRAGSTIRAGTTIRGASLRVQNHQPEALLKLITEEHGYRNYHGRLSIEAAAESPADRLRIVNIVDLEDYVASVVGSEMQSNQHEALKAQAVIARTYVLRTMHEAGSGQGRGSGSDTYQPYIFTDDEQYQVYLGDLGGINTLDKDYYITSFAREMQDANI